MPRFCARPSVLRVALTLAVGLGAVASVGCNSCNEKALTADPDAGGHRTSTSLTPEQAAKVLAKVGDHTITLGDYAAALEHMDNFDRLRYQSPERRKELLAEMINVELLAREAQLKGYDKDPAAQQEIRAILRDAMLKEARKGAPMPADVPEAEVRAFFDAHKAEYRDPERRRASVIVLATEAAAKDVLEQAKKTAGAAQATQWGELVRSKSTDSQAKANVPVDLVGDVGMVSPPGDGRGENTRIPEGVRVGLFEIPKVHDVLERVVAAEGRFYVVRLTQKTEAHDRSYQEAERAIRVKLAQDKIRAKEDELLAQLRTKYPVVVDEKVLSTVRVDLGTDAGALGAPPSADAGRD
jgi:peptidyl-prolyl cis-trans isomerase C